MNRTDLISTGVVVLSVVAIAYGGTFLLRVLAGAVPSNDLQRSFFRAGHAHAGVLVTLGLVVRILVADPRVPEWSSTLAGGVLYSAILIPAGFFLSVTGRDPQRPNAFRLLIWLGAGVLTVGLGGAGAGLVGAGVSAA